MRDRYCRNLQTQECQRHAMGLLHVGRTEVSYSALKPYSFSIICCTLRRGMFCSRCNVNMAFLYGSQSAERIATALGFRGRFDEVKRISGTTGIVDAEKDRLLPVSPALNRSWLACSAGPSASRGHGTHHKVREGAWADVSSRSPCSDR